MEKSEKLHTLGSVKKTDKQNSSKELIKRKEIKDTPFTVISVKNGNFGVMGEYRITEVKESIKEVEKELKEITWNRIVQVMMILTKKTEKL